MKNWIKYTLGILITLVILAAVGGAGFMFGARQSGTFVHPMMNGSAQSFGNGFDPHQGMNGGRDFHNFGRGYDRGGFGGFFSPLFGLIKLAVLAALGWIGYRFIKNSGWKLTRETASAPAAPEVVEAAAPSGSPAEENKE